jgi:3-isopropylmalate/(R)-2-methylmalate dehydratase small subunit
MGADVFHIIDQIAGRGIPLRGNDIDTDRIIPARYLKTVRFEGLEAHAFEDDRIALEGRPTPHPFDNAAYRGANVLIVNGNFGCGSSREHAPQALQRWGINLILGESFSEIFFGNSLALGLPCLSLSPADIEALMSAVEADPAARLVASVSALTVTTGGLTVRAHLPEGVREAFVKGTWDATSLLLDRFEDVRQAAARLPYIHGF